MQLNVGEQAFQDLTAELAFTCPGALPSVVQRVVMRAIRQFARETCIFQTTIAQQTQDGVATYELGDSIPQGFDIDHIQEVRYCGECIYHIGKCLRCRSPMSCGCASANFEMKSADCIQLHPCPSGSYPLEVHTVLCPDYDLCEIPSELKKYSDVVMLLAEGLMMKIPKQKWTNYRVGEGKRREAMGELIDIRCRVDNNFTNEAPQVGERII